MLLSILSLVLATLNATADVSQHIQIPAYNTTTQVPKLILNYQATCTTPGHFPLVDFRIGNRVERVNLFPSRNISESLLFGARPSSDIAIQFQYSGDCQITALEPLVVILNYSAPNFSDGLDSSEKQSLALFHSPFINARSDQYANYLTDIPMALVYTVHNLNGGGFRLKYTALFSDEDSKTSIADTNGQMTRYGRRSDIEWVYSVTFDRNGHITAREYQGRLHFTLDFTGRTIEETHAILYNIADNNIFSENPIGNQSSGDTGYSLVPESEVNYPQARESVMFAQPWMFMVSDQELYRERRLSHPSDEYLFIRIRGTQSTGAILPQIQFRESDGTLNTTVYGGEPLESNFDRLGEDMWNRESYTAIPIPRALLNAYTQGNLNLELSFRNDRVRDSNIQISEIEVLKLERDGTTYITTELRPLICTGTGVHTQCHH